MRSTPVHGDEVRLFNFIATLPGVRPCRRASSMTCGLPWNIIKARSTKVSIAARNVNYVVRGDMLFIAAVAHLNRRPGYWGQRLTQRAGR